MLRILALCALLVVGLTDGRIQKISNSIIKQGTEIYHFYNPTRGGVEHTMFVETADSFPLAYYAIARDTPAWVNYTLTGDMQPDINVLSKNQVRLYFVANIDARTQAIGVAVSDKLQPKNNGFVPLSLPLVTAFAGETLSHPALYKADDGRLYLTYFNSTAFHTWGSVVKVPLTADGLQVTGPQESIYKVTP